MDQKEEVEKAVKRGSRAGCRQKRYTFEEKLRAVKLHLEEGFICKMVCEETGVSTSSLAVWVRDYRKEGEMGLCRLVRESLARCKVPLTIPLIRYLEWICHPPNEGNLDEISLGRSLDGCVNVGRVSA